MKIEVKINLEVYYVRWLACKFEKYVFFSLILIYKSGRDVKVKIFMVISKVVSKYIIWEDNKSFCKIFYCLRKVNYWFNKFFDIVYLFFY